VYVVTFYSFKGGVGRTMALVNVGVELARRGNRVLLVDFDLEAPGLETFNLGVREPEAAGITEFVGRYIDTGEAPDVGEYIYECPGVGGKGGRLWIMPAGKPDPSYPARLHSIDWQRLYSEHDGYLLFEDLKEQWRQLLKPQYVLIDSRTGHTDVGGICTRQLPDAVVVLFFPNEQNLSGLVKVVSDIRREAERPRQKSIALHFVTANVPDLDDEDRILETRIRRFQELLGYENLSATIHHYDSLALLNQVVFMRDRPRSRLAREYHSLVRVIARENPEDREGVLEFLDDVMTRPSRVTTAGLKERLDLVRASHPSDGEILCRLSQLYEWQGLREDAVALLNEAVAVGYERPSALLRRAELRSSGGDNQGAVEDLLKVLESEGAGFLEVSRTVRLLQRIRPDALAAVSQSPALRSLRPRERVDVAEELLRDRKSLRVAESILREALLDRECTVAEHDGAKNHLVLCLIGQARFREAMEAISPARPDPTILSIQCAFNYAMAEWGETGVPPQDLLRRVVELDSQGSSRDTPNYSQCLAIAFWALGEMDLARERLGRARHQIRTPPRSHFSAWRYLEVSPATFEKDLDEIGSLIDGEDIVPAFARHRMGGAR